MTVLFVVGTFMFSVGLVRAVNEWTKGIFLPEKTRTGHLYAYTAVMVAGAAVIGGVLGVNA
ncbi:hypothetical protein [Corynebacterium neomassiliense]|uniref:hypothetical protein n=1 Tax=Corynebacterium neomassiliense TaxID=2079482 RepID=UPI00102F9703|nr:hypothetical protein [Corynebacterium neomassiliense]